MESRVEWKFLGGLALSVLHAPSFLSGRKGVYQVPVLAHIGLQSILLWGEEVYDTAAVVMKILEMC